MPWSQVSQAWKVKIEPVHTACLDFRFLKQPTVTDLIEAIGWSEVEFNKEADQLDKERLDFEILREVCANMGNLGEEPIDPGHHSIRVAGALVCLITVSSERIFK